MSPDAAPPSGATSKVSPSVIICHDPRSPHAEQYRAFRTNLTALNRGGGPWAIVVTSSRKGEGKSITAANVAACLAELPGQRVCLLDVDFRRPTQHELFGIQRSPGVSELLQDKATLQQATRSSYTPSLDIIPAGEEPRSPAEVLGGTRFGNLLSELKHRYSWVLIDTPPVHPYTDACVLASRSNGAVLVVRMEDTSKDLALRTTHAIQRAGGKVLGSFLTGLPIDREDADRVGRYRADPGDPRAAAQDRARREAKKRLKDQEKAWDKLKDEGDEPKEPEEEPSEPQAPRKPPKGKAKD